MTDSEKAVVRKALTMYGVAKANLEWLNSVDVQGMSLLERIDHDIAYKMRDAEFLYTYRALLEAVEKLLADNQDAAIGPNSPENASNDVAWELSRRNCPCRDCKGEGGLPCDECGVAA